MHIDWTTLATVAVVAAAAALTVVLLVAFGIVAVSSRSDTGVDGPGGGHASGTYPVVGTTIAVLCMLAAGLIVGYGLYLIIA